jgi:hypothetical protein
MADTKEEIAATLTLLFADMDGPAIGGHLYAFLNKAKKLWPAIYEINNLDGIQGIYFDPDDILTTLDDQDEEYTGTREHLNACMLDHEINNSIWESLGYERDDVEKLLRKQGHIKAKGPTDGVPDDH